MLRKIAQPFYTAWVLISFAISILLLSPLYLVLGMGGNRQSRKAVFRLTRLWARFWLFIIGMPTKIIGNRPADRRYVVVANHISYLDTLDIFPAIPGYFRALGKKEVAGIPLIGFIYKQLVILVDRADVHSKARSMRLMWRTLHEEGSIVIFPEGTFNETGMPLKSFYDGAFRLAINAQAPIFPVVLPDTVNRWHYSAWWKLWPGPNRVVYLEPVEVKGLTPERLPELRKMVFDKMESALVKYRKQG